MLIITGDMNAKVGNLVNGLGRVMGRHGLGTVIRLKEFCDFNEMVITGTVFTHKAEKQRKIFKYLKSFEARLQRILTRLVNRSLICSHRIEAQVNG